HDEIYPCDEGATTQGHALAHRMDEFRAGYSLAAYAPAEPASASPAGVHHAIPSLRRPSEMQRIENSVLTACLTQGDKPKYHVVFIPKATAEGAIWKSPPATRGDFPCPGPTEGMPNYRRAFEAG